MNIAYRTQDTKEVESDDSFTMRQPVDDAFEELRFGDAYCKTGGYATNFEEGIKEVFERVGFGGDKAFQKRLKRPWLHQFIL